MDEIKLEIGTLKINNKLLCGTTGAFILLGLGFFSDNIINESVVSNVAGGIMCFNAGITGKMLYDNNKQLKKIRKM